MINKTLTKKDLEMAQSLYNISHYGTPEVPYSETNDLTTRKAIIDIAKNVRRFIDFFNKK